MRIRSHDPITGQPVAVEAPVRGDQASWDPPTAVYNVARLGGVGPLVHTCCGITHFFTAPAMAEWRLGARPELRGRVLDQAEPVAAAVGMFATLLADDADPGIRARPGSRFHPQRAWP